MTIAPTAPVRTRRLLAGPLGGSLVDHAAHREVHGELPRLDLDSLLALTAASGLTGRGGAGFPTDIKVRAVVSTRRRPIVVGNAMEGEPLSRKDAVLLDSSPHLVLDGLEILARAMRAKRAILAVGPEIDAAPATRAAAEGSRSATSTVASSRARRPRWSTSSTAAPRCPGTRSRG